MFLPESRKIKSQMKMLKNEYIDFKFDAHFDSIASLTWLPFVGKKYDESSPKWLVVGESHFVPQNEDESLYLNKEWTREYILKDGLQVPPWHNNEVKNNLTREIEKTLFNKLDNTIWSSLAYYNLIQRLLTSRSKDDRPNYPDIVKGLKNFIEVVSILKPNRVVFCGVEAGKHFEYILNENQIEVQSVIVEHVKINGTYPKRFDININGQIIKCIFIKHPSMGYSAEKWRKYILEM